MKQYFLLAVTLITSHGVYAAQVREKIIDETLNNDMHDPICYPSDNYVVEELKELFSGEKIPNINNRSEFYLLRTPLIRTICKGQLKSTQLLISLGADVNIQDSHGETALIIACREGAILMEKAIEFIKLLIANGADEQISNSSGKNALSFNADFVFRHGALKAALAERRKKCAEYKQNIVNPILENTNLLSDLAHIIVGYVCAEIPREIMPDVPQETNA